MVSKAYITLAKRFNKPPMRTAINDVFLEMMELLFTEEEAAIVSKMPTMRATAEKIAKIVRRPVSEVRPILESMSERGLIFYFGDGLERKYFVMGIIPGIFEAKMCVAPNDEDTIRFAELYNEYVTPKLLANILRKRPAHIFKIVPINKNVPNDSGIMPADRLREVIDRHDAWSLANYCACRRQKELIDEGCDKPKDVCMQFGVAARYVDNAGFGRLVSKEEILEAVDRAESSGLVHLTDNVELANLSCNCCACCCVAMETLRKFNNPMLLAKGLYVAKHDAEKCNACGTCVKTCPMGALHLYEKRVIFEPLRCIGCGVCISKCKDNAVKLELKADRRLVPENFGQLMVDVGSELIGVKKHLGPIAPGFTQVIGNWLQNHMSKQS